MEREKYKAECDACKATGLYQGMAEKERDCWPMYKEKAKDWD